MAWLYNGRKINPGQSWTTTAGVTHPGNWNVWSTQAKLEAGLTLEEETASQFDGRFYWAKDVERAVEDRAEVDADGNPILDAKGVQIVTPGLKTTLTATVKQQAAGQLAGTDWMVTRKAETGAEIPANVTAYRAAVRAASGTIEAAIAGCTTLADIIALHETPVDGEGVPTGNAPIADWPEAI